MHIRELTIDDVHTVRELATHLNGHPKHGDPVIDYVEFSRWIGNPNFVVYGTFDGNQLVAKIIVEITPSTNIAILKGLRVHREYRRQSIGENLLRYAIDRTSEKEIEALICYISTSNLESLNLTKKCSFVECVKAFGLGTPSPFPKPLRELPDGYEITSFSEADFLKLARDIPDFFEGDYYPNIWDFDPINTQGVRRVYSKNTVKALMNQGNFISVFSHADVVYYLHGKPTATRSVAMHSSSKQGMRIALDVVLGDLHDSDNQYIGIRTGQRTLDILQDRFAGSEQIDIFDVIVLNRDVLNV